MRRLYDFTHGLAFSIITNQEVILIATLIQKNQQCSSCGLGLKGVTCLICCSLQSSLLLCGGGTSKAYSTLKVDVQLYWAVFWLCPGQPSLNGRFGTVLPALQAAAMLCSLPRSGCQLVPKPVLCLSGVVLNVIPVLSEMVRCTEKNLPNVEQYDTWVLWRRYTWNGPA